MKLSTIGVTLGAAGLLLALFSFWAGPFTPQPTLETTVGEKVAAIKTATINALKGKEAEKTYVEKSWDADRIIRVVTAMLGGLALILGIVAFAQSESKRMSGGAVALGASAIAFQFIAMYAMAFLVVVLIAAALESVGLDFGG